MMRVAANWRSRRWTAFVVVALFILMAQPATSTKIDRNNTMIRWYCSFYKVMNGQFFQRNLNTTFSSLRKQLSRVNVYHAVARTLINGESVYGLALCREYLTNEACLACFDTAVAYLKVCGLGNGAHIFYDDCELRYENSNFYNEAIIKTSVGICGNRTSSHTKELQKAARGLFSDLNKATPKTSNFFAASTRRISGSNQKVYAIAQCSQNLSQSVCVDCLKIRQRSLDDCLPNTHGRAIDSGCFMRYSETPFFGMNQTTDITPFLRNGNSSSRSIIGGVVGGIGLLFFILTFVFWHRRSRKSNGRQQGKSTGATDMLQRPIVFTFNDLKIATNNFCEENKVGGVNGKVFKGVMKDGNTVAIKKTVMISKSGKAYLDGDLKIISNVHHRHLIRLLGYCSKGSHLYLVLEYMENGSLDKFLYGDKGRILNWKQRFDIIFGTARGLAYLHEQYHVTIIHGDIKSSNILLDNELQPKIADFGLVKLLPEDKTRVSAKVTGTLSNCYRAPEYTIYGQLSEKIDTYSFGVVVLEIISGKWCNGLVENESVPLNLVENARSLYENEMFLDLIDVTLDLSEYVQEEAKKIIEIALMCTQPTASARPTMSEVVMLLSESSLDERLPIRSTLNDRDVRIQVETSTSNQESNATSS